MTDATLTPAQRQAMVDALNQILPAAVLDPWDEIRFTYSAVAEETAVEFIVVRSDGSCHRLNAPYKATRLLRDLRAGMYQPGRGTWFTARFVLEPNAGVRAAYEYDTEPVFAVPLPRGAYAADLRRFPRHPGAVPPWLAERLAPVQ